MTPQECLVKICKYKNDKIKELIGIDLYNEKDYEDLLQIIDKYAKRIVDHMQNNLYLNKSISNGTTCPWCIDKKLYTKSCNTCSYAQNHGNIICDNKESRYSIIISVLCHNHLPTDFINILKMREGIQEILNEYKNNKN